MAIDYTRIKEGDAVNAAALNDRFSDFETAFNDIDLPSIEREGLTEEHLPSLIPAEFDTVGGVAVRLSKAAPDVETTQLTAIDPVAGIVGAGGIPNLVTVTTAAAHNLDTGHRVDIAGTVNYNETDAGPITVTGANTFTYYAGMSPVYAGVVNELVGNVGGNSSYDRYNNTLPVSGGPAFPFTYQTFVVNPVGPGPGTAVISEALAGWRIPAYKSVGANEAKVDLTTPVRFDQAVAGMLCKGILVRGSYELRDKRGLGPIGNQAFDPMRCAAIAIGWQDSAGTLHCVERSVRFYSVTAVQRGSLSTSTLLTQDDLDLGDGTCANVFVCVAGCIRGEVSDNSPPIPGTQQDLEMRYYNVTTWPLHAGDL